MLRVKSFVIRKFGFSVEGRKGMMSEERLWVLHSMVPPELCWLWSGPTSKTQNKRKKCSSSHLKADSGRFSYCIPGIGADRRWQQVPHSGWDQGGQCSDCGSTPPYSEHQGIQRRIMDTSLWPRDHWRLCKARVHGRPAEAHGGERRLSVPTKDDMDNRRLPLPVIPCTWLTCPGCCDLSEHTLAVFILPVTKWFFRALHIQF